MKTYVLMVSKTFPTYHPKAGQPTNFVEKIARLEKIHTIRGNYPLWQKRIAQIERGEARLSIRVWTGKPYRSTQREVLAFEYASCQLLFDSNKELTVMKTMGKPDAVPPLTELAKNDGLSLEDFNAWFPDKTGEWAIIHFTKFRY